MTDAAPEGSVVHVVIPDAHAEVSLDEGEGHLRRPEVLSEIIRAAERSVDSPLLADSPLRPRLHNAFGYCFWLAGERERTRREFERAGPFVTGPFRFSSSPLRLAAGARRQVGAPGRS